MDKIILDGDAVAKLKVAPQICVVCDAEGQVIGHFVPALVPQEGDQLEPPVNDEELERRERNGGGRPLADILADLEKQA